MIEEGVDVASLAVLHVDLQAVAHAVAHNHRRREGKDLRVLDACGTGKDLLDDSIFTVLASLALVPMLQVDYEGACRGALGTTHQVVTHNLGEDAYLRNLLDTSLNLIHDVLGLSQ